MYWLKVREIILISALLFFVFAWSVLFEKNFITAGGSTMLFVAALMLLASGVRDRPLVAFLCSIAAGCLIFVALSWRPMIEFADALVWFLLTVPLTFVYTMALRKVYLEASPQAQIPST